MKRSILYKLSREALYPPYVELRASGVSEETLGKIQFLDEKPTELFWETYLSKKEDRVVYFEHDLTIKFCYSDYSESEEELFYSDLDAEIGENKIFILFQSSKTGFCFSRENLKEILDAIYFMDNEDILLYCLDSKVIITGGYRGFTVWEKLKFK
ncbi:hypothetical protein [Neisseria sicca]